MWDIVRHYWEYIGNNTKSNTPPSSKGGKPEQPLGWLTSLAARMFFGLPVFFAIFGVG
jgi:hypothetical protein